MAMFDEDNIIQLWMDDAFNQDLNIDGYIRHIEQQLLQNFGNFENIADKEVLFHPKRKGKERVIDGKDNRELVKNTKKSFHPAVAHMIMIYTEKQLRGKDVYFNGTGFLCSYKDRHFLLTAKHNVVDSAGGGREFTGRTGLFSSMATSHFPSRVQKAREVRIYFGRNGIKTKPNDCITVSGSNFNPAYGSRDYAILDLSAESAKLPGVRLDIGSLQEGLDSKKIQIAGYPGCRSYGTRTYGAEPYTQWLTQGVSVELDGHHLKYKEATEGGNSGSPLIFKNKKKGCWSVLGVHVSGGLDYNYAEACDDEMLSSVTRWLEMITSVPQTIKSIPRKDITSSTSKTKPATKDKTTKPQPVTSMILPRPKPSPASGQSVSNPQSKQDKTGGSGLSLFDRLKRSPLPSTPTPVSSDKTTKKDVYTLVVPRPTVPASHLTKSANKHTSVVDKTSMAAGQKSGFLFGKASKDAGKSGLSLAKRSTTTGTSGFSLAKSCSSLDKAGIHSSRLFDRMGGRDEFFTGSSSPLFNDLMMSHDLPKSSHVTRTVTKQTNDGGLVKRTVDIKVTQHTSSSKNASAGRLTTFDQSLFNFK